MTMDTDPILEEIYKVRDEIAEEFGNDIHAYFEYIRKLEQEHKDKLVTLEPRPVRRPTVSKKS